MGDTKKTKHISVLVGEIPQQFSLIFVLHLTPRLSVIFQVSSKLVQVWESYNQKPF